MFNPLHDINGSRNFGSKVSKKFANERVLGYRKQSPREERSPMSNYQKIFEKTEKKKGKKARPKSSVSYSKGHGSDVGEDKMGMSTKKTRIPSGKTRKSRPFSSRSIYRSHDKKGFKLGNSHIEGNFLRFFYYHGNFAIKKIKRKIISITKLISPLFTNFF